MQARPAKPLRKSNSLGSLPSHSVVDEHADHACGMATGSCSPPSGRAKSLHSLPLDQFRADHFARHPEVRTFGPHIACIPQTLYVYSVQLSAHAST